MFRPLLGHLQALWKNRSKSYLYFNALWDPKCLQIVLYECKMQYNTICKHLGSHLLTPWCRVLPEQLTGLQLVKKFPAFHGTHRFITALTSVRHLSLSWASPIQSIYPHLTSWRSILILSTHLRLGFPSGLYLSNAEIIYDLVVWTGVRRSLLTYSMVQSPS